MLRKKVFGMPLFVWLIIVAGFLLVASASGGQKNQVQASIPPTATAKAIPTSTPGLTVQESTYQAALTSQIQTLGKSLTQFSTLMQSPKPLDKTWRTSLVIELAIWQVSYQDALRLQPSPRLQPANDKYVTAMALYDSVATDIASALDNWDTTRVNTAVNKMTQAKTLIEESGQLLKAAH